jgi:acetoin utilization deacetylase AcuC-like enzyme
MNLTSECFALMTARLMSWANALCDGRLVLCHEGGYSSTYVPYCGLAIVEQLASVRTEVVDPWISDTRQVRWLPLRVHEAQAIERVRVRHGLSGDPVQLPGDPVQARPAS